MKEKEQQLSHRVDLLVRGLIGGGHLLGAVHHLLLASGRAIGQPLLPGSWDGVEEGCNDTKGQALPDHVEKGEGVAAMRALR